MKSRYLKGVIAFSLATAITNTYCTTTIMALEQSEVKVEENKKSDVTIPKDENNAKEDNVIKDESKEDTNKKEEEKIKDESNKKEEKPELAVNESEEKNNNDKEKGKENKEVTKEDVSLEEEVKEDKNKGTIPVEVWGGYDEFIEQVCSKSGVSDIKKVTYDDLSKIKMLELTGGDIKTPEIFSKFTGLVSLKIQNCNNLNEVLKYVSEIKGLKELDVSFNYLNDLPSSMSNLTNLEFIDISYNSFGKVPEVIYKLPKLQYLSASGCNISNVSSSIGTLNNLVSLELSRNNMSSLPSELYGIKSLRYLGLEENAFTEIPAKIFTMKNLEDLSFKSNKIISIPNEIQYMKGDKTPFTLDISINQVAKLPKLNGQNIIAVNNYLETSKKGVSTSNKLELQQKVFEVNKNKEITQEDLRKLVKCTRYKENFGREVIDVDNRHNLEFVIDNKVVKANELKNLEDGVYDAKLKIEAADLDNTAAISTGSIKIKVGNVEVKPDDNENNKPNIPDNATGIVPIEYWEDCNSLMLFVVDYLNVSNINEVTFEDLAEIEYLDISNSGLIELPSIVAKFKNLTAIYADENEFTKVPEQIYKLENLSYISLGFNKIEKIPGELSKLDNLKAIMFAGNNIHEIDDEFKNIKSLEALELSYNTNIQDELYKLGDIETLIEIWIQGCNLTEISDKVTSLPNLQYLFYSNNQLTKELDLPNAKTSSRENIIYKEDESYKKLYLTNNKLNVIKGSNISQDTLRELVVLKLTGIPEEYEEYYKEALNKNHNVTFVINNKEYTADEVSKFKAGRYEAKLKVASADMSNSAAITDETIELTVNGKDIGGEINPDNPVIDNNGQTSGNTNGNNTAQGTNNVVTTAKKTTATLPKTGGASAAVASLFGIASIAVGGRTLRNKRK